MVSELDGLCQRGGCSPKGDRHEAVIGLCASDEDVLRNGVNMRQCVSKDTSPQRE